MSELFEYPWVLTLLLLVPAYGLLLYGRSRKRSGPMIFSRVSLARTLKAGPRVWLARLMPVLRLVALTLLILACARPSLPQEESAEVEGIDIYVCLDLSGSMQAIDIEDAELAKYQKAGKEPPNRFIVAKEVLKDFVGSRSVDRIGMVVFARDAFLQFPMTIDYSTILTQLEQLQLGDIEGSGTAIGNALGRAVAGLRDTGVDEEAGDERTRIVILITDGDRRGGNISPMEAARFAKERGIKIFPILVGKEGKARVPVGRDLFSGRVTYSFQEYPVDATLLEKIATTTGGEFYRASNKKALSLKLHRILNSFERAKIEDTANVTRTQLFGPLAALAAFLLMLEMSLVTVVIRPFP